VLIQPRGNGGALIGVYVGAQHQLVPAGPSSLPQAQQLMRENGCDAVRNHSHIHQLSAHA